ncbi:MAG: class I SAM-dependent methyltransferase [Deltaproteobacteria bacterium]|nr:class I SAM-dependent methyltransferase [Deltaproteobacteria bacterium]
MQAVPRKRAAQQAAAHPLRRFVVIAGDQRAHLKLNPSTSTASLFALARPSNNSSSAARVRSPALRAARVHWASGSFSSTSWPPANSGIRLGAAMDEGVAGWKSVSDTLLIPLYCRAMETLEQEPIIRDPKAVGMLNEMRRELASSDKPIHRKVVHDRYNRKLLVTIALRSRRFDRYASEFMAAHPGATVVTIGCGLDSRFERIDDGRVRWFDLDFPEVIEIRKRYFRETDRCRFLPYSALDYRWMDEVKTAAAGPVLFLAEGVFMYLEEEAVKGLVLKLRDEFPGSELVFEITNRYWVKKMKSAWMRWKFSRQLGIGEEAMFRFGIDGYREIEKWGTGIRFLDEWTYFDDDEKKLGWFNLFRRMELLRKVQWTLHFQLGE